MRPRLRVRRALSSTTYTGHAQTNALLAGHAQTDAFLASRGYRHEDEKFTTFLGYIWKLARTKVSERKESGAKKLGRDSVNRETWLLSKENKCVVFTSILLTENETGKYTQG